MPSNLAYFIKKLYLGLIVANIRRAVCGREAAGEAVGAYSHTGSTRRRTRRPPVYRTPSGPLRSQLAAFVSSTRGGGASPSRSPLSHTASCRARELRAARSCTLLTARRASALPQSTRCTPKSATSRAAPTQSSSAN